MITYYAITKELQSFLISDSEINTVTIGGFDEVDINKQSIYGLAHILVNSAEFLTGTVRFSMTITVMDIVDERKNNLRDLEADERWKGISNKQDVLNTMLSVLERLNKYIINTLSDEGYELNGNMTAEPFEDRFEHLLTGWSTTFNVDVPNTIQNC